jgi:putative hydrolase of the HAD superfamily
LDPYFEKIFLSNEIGLRKPKPEGFKHIIETQGLNKSETLFIDDSQQHIDGAKKVGLHAKLLNVEKEDIKSLVKRLSLI